MDFKKAYEDALERAKQGLPINEVFPELKESEDERVIKRLSSLVRILNSEFFKGDNPSKEQCLAYLEKQQETNPSTTENISAVYQLGLANGRKEQKPVEGDNETEIQKAFREGKSAGRKEVFDHPEEYGLQKEQKPAELSDAERKQLYSDGFNTARKALANTLMQYIDEHRPEGKMCLSNGECAQLDNAFKVGDVETIVRYIHKYQQPAEWNKEDELMRDAVLNTLERIGDYGTIGMQKDWLKSLRPQPKYKQEEIVLCWEKGHPEPYKSVLILRHGNVVVEGEWNEETGRWYQYGFKCYLEDNEVDGWMNKKSLLSGNSTFQPHWKPSEEQPQVADASKMERSAQTEKI